MSARECAPDKRDDGAVFAGRRRARAPGALGCSISGLRLVGSVASINCRCEVDARVGVGIREWTGRELFDWGEGRLFRFLVFTNCLCYKQPHEYCKRVVFTLYSRLYNREQSKLTRNIVRGNIMMAMSKPLTRWRGRFVVKRRRITKIISNFSISCCVQETQM